MEGYNIELSKNPNLLLQNHTLAKGLYIVVNSKDGTYEEFEVAKDSGYEEHRLFNKVKEFDLYSRYLNSNKAYGDKKIGSVTYTSLILKGDNLRLKK